MEASLGRQDWLDHWSLATNSINLSPLPSLDVRDGEENSNPLIQVYLGNQPPAILWDFPKVPHFHKFRCGWNKLVINNKRLFTFFFPKFTLITWENPRVRQPCSRKGTKTSIFFLLQITISQKQYRKIPQNWEHDSRLEGHHECPGQWMK